MDGLEAVLDALLTEKVNTDVWVDGSFLTQKINPKDSDILLHVDGVFYDNATPEQRRIIDWVNQEDLKTPHLCDSYVHYSYPSGHPQHTFSVYMFSYWMRQYGFSRPDPTTGQAFMKGIAVVRL
ncbi:MAG TPA: hypothetical protein VEY11_11355 [Pyrinomonadaceae bacterium]|nr:hypothetical protein [Pyrinomonadaceae bacterium]